MFNKRKPLSARSVLASALLGSRHGALPVARLVRVAEVFGVSPNAARVALSRMVASGELTAEGGSYALADRLGRRRARQDRGRLGPPDDWDGTWWLVHITGAARSAASRAGHRRTLAAEGLAEVRDGVWVRPANLDVPPLDFATRARGTFVDPAPQVDALWPVVEWARQARDLTAELSATRDLLEADDPGALAAGFALSAEVLRLLAADPLLPHELLPADWPGPDLRATYDDWDRAYRRLLAHWHATA